MIMVRHQAVGMADPTVTTNHPAERAQEQLAVGIGEKYFLARIPAARQMIDGTGIFQS